MAKEDERGLWCLGEFGMKSGMRRQGSLSVRALLAWVPEQLHQGAVWSLFPFAYNSPPPGSCSGNADSVDAKSLG